MGWNRASIGRELQPGPGFSSSMDAFVVRCAMCCGLCGKALFYPYARGYGRVMS